VSATLLGGEIEINNFTFDESIAQQFADSMIYQLEKRLRTAIEAQPEKEVAHVTQ
jgi:hypothetical protein